MKSIKLLFTSVGRRVELIQAFHQAAISLGVNLTIIGADIADDAPALQFCDVRKTICKIKDEQYIPQLLLTCEEEHVDCLIPTIDTDLLLLAENKHRFEAIGTKVLISEADKVSVCRDKNFTTSYFHSLGLKAPIAVNSVDRYQEMLEMGLASFPAFIKPKDGSSSIDAYKVENLYDLRVYAEKIGDYIVQPFISGKEFTVDIFCDYDGNPVFITPRERIAVRAGEVLKTKITQDDRMIAEMMTLVKDFKPVGQITVQLIIDDTTGDDYYIEINPRFGGGAPLSIKAGADSAEAVLRMLSGEKLTYQEKAARDGEVYSRFDQSVCVSSKSDVSYEAVIFDLDDTLYSEKEYVRSGFKAVASLVPQICNMESKLWRALQDGKAAIDTVLQNEGIYTQELAETCLNTYRMHMPDIHLYDGIAEMLYSLRCKGIRLGIITDGRPKGQRNKIKALHLDELVDEIIITDELGGEMFRKPDDISFRIMQKKLGVPFERMVYVGDNPQKDFKAPQKLGMRSIWFQNQDGIYYGKQPGLVMAGVCVNSMSDLSNALKNT